MATYTVYMVNFNMTKGTFNTAQEAIDQAKALGFECAIWVNEPGKDSLYLCNVKPY
jgi:hypothetical protein